MAAIEEAWEFVHDREAFGREVAGFQAVQHILADMRTEYEATRSLTWRAAEKVEVHSWPNTHRQCDRPVEIPNAVCWIR